MSATACAALLLAGCGGSDESSTPSGAPSTPRDQLVLSESEFPAGSKKMDIPRDKMLASLSDVGDTMANSTVTPADCKGPQIDLSAGAKAVLDKSTFAVASSPDMSAMYVDYVSDQVMDLPKLVDNYAKCPDVQVSTTVQGKQIDTTTKLEKLAAPADLSGTNAVAYRSTATMDGGPGIPRVTFEGFVTLRDRTVSVRVVGMGSGSDPDQAAFDKFFTAAVRKVQNAK
ncbi:hypothetical protein GCM10027167_10870 [Nocardia heshunensis]